MNNLKRFTACKVMNHKWVRVAYQESVEGTGFFLRCQRCDKENHKGTSVRPTII